MRAPPENSWPVARQASAVSVCLFAGFLSRNCRKLTRPRALVMPIQRQGHDPSGIIASFHVEVGASEVLTPCKYRRLGRFWVVIGCLRPRFWCHLARLRNCRPHSKVLWHNPVDTGPQISTCESCPPQIHFAEMHPGNPHKKLLADGSCSPSFSLKTRHRT